MSALLMFGDGGFNPRTLFAANEQGAWYDPSDFSTLYQDSAGTTPVTAAGQAVGRINDKSGRGNHATQATAGNRPVLRQDSSGRYYLEFDGATSNRWLQTASINFTGTDKMTVWAGLRKESDAAAAIVCELSANLNTNNGSFFIAAPASAANNYSFSSKGTVQSSGVAAGYTSPISSVLTGIGNISGDVARIRVNQVSVTGAADQGTGNYGNYPLYIGLRGGTTLPFNGRLYQLIVRGAASNDGQIAAGEAWCNIKTRAY